MSLNDKDTAIVEKAVQGALEHLEKEVPEEYAKLNADPEKKKFVTDSARAAATEQVLLAKEFAGQPDDIAERLAKHLPETRITMLRKALEFPTFRMDITKKSDGKYWVELTRGGKALEPARALSTNFDIDWSKVKQGASIIVEAVVLVLSAVGISVSSSAKATEEAMEITVRVMKRSSELQRALDAFIEAWIVAGASKHGRAEGIFFLIKDIHATGILWYLIGAVISSKSIMDRQETFIRVSATIISALSTEGAALIAEIALAVTSAADFVRKVSNVSKLEGIKNAM